MDMACVCTPRRSSSSSIFIAVVVLPLPDGPESSTIGLLCMFSIIMEAAFAMRLLYMSSHSAMNPRGSVAARRLISLR